MRHNRGYQLFRLTHFDYGDDDVMLLEGGEGLRASKGCEVGGAPSVPLARCRESAMTLTGRP
jgi:hypothetical protein